MPTKHRRFALLEVTYEGASIPNATMDCWEDDQGRTQWSARALVNTAGLPDSGRLTGRTKEGDVVSGEVLVANHQMGPRGPRQTLVEFRGTGDLEEASRPTM
jgi:hypothetical protein